MHAGRENNVMWQCNKKRLNKARNDKTFPVPQQTTPGVYSGLFNNLRWLVLTARSIDYHSWKSSAKQSELRGLLMIIDLQVPEVFILFLSEAGR